MADEQSVIEGMVKKREKVVKAIKEGGLIQKDSIAPPVAERKVELKTGWRESLGQMLGTRPKKKAE